MSQKWVVVLNLFHASPCLPTMVTFSSHTHRNSAGLARLLSFRLHEWASSTLAGYTCLLLRRAVRKFVQWRICCCFSQPQPPFSRTPQISVMLRHWSWILLEEEEKEEEYDIHTLNLLTFNLLSSCFSLFPDGGKNYQQITGFRFFTSLFAPNKTNNTDFFYSNFLLATLVSRADYRLVRFFPRCFILTSPDRLWRHG